MAEVQLVESEDRPARFIRAVGHVFPEISPDYDFYRFMRQQQDRYERAVQMCNPKGEKFEDISHLQITSPVRRPRPCTPQTYKQWLLEQKWKQITNFYLNTEWWLARDGEKSCAAPPAGSPDAPEDGPSKQDDPQKVLELPANRKGLEYARTSIVQAEEALTGLFGDMKPSDKQDLDLLGVFVFCHKLIVQCRKEVDFHICRIMDSLRMPLGR